jgi:large subunit ribosomal protein L13
MIVINGENKIFGRLASYVAKKLVDTTDQVIVVNSRNIMISGDRKKIITKYLDKLDKGGKGNPRNNPKYPRYPDRLFKRAVRGMLPRNATGLNVLRKLKVYIDVPDDCSKEIPKAVILQHIKQISLEELTKHLGAKIKEIKN